MGMNAIEKILSSHSEQQTVRPGDVVAVEVDITVHFDFMSPDILRINDPDKVVLMHDHVVPAPTVQAANNAKHMREFVERFGIKNYFPVGKHGISHVLVAAGGLRASRGDPGQRRLPHVLLGRAQLPRPRHGALGDDLHPVQGPDVVPRRPDDQGRARGELPERVFPRDVIHYIPGHYGDFAGRNLEWYGDGLASIGMDGRLTMATISAELSAEFSLFPYDHVLAEYLEGRAKCAVRAGVPRRRRRVRPGDHRRPVVARTAGRAARQGGVELEGRRRGRRRQDQGRPGVHRFVRQRPPQRLRHRRRDRARAGRSRRVPDSS